MENKLFRYIKVVYDPISPFEYSYLDNGRIAAVGDYVWVPVGRYNEERIAYVVSVGDYAAEDAPFPVERTKAVIRLATQTEVDGYDDSWQYLN